MEDDKWLKFYSSDIEENIRKVFIKIMTFDGEHFFFSDYNKWFLVKEHCQKNSTFIKDMHLQFRTNQIILDVNKAKAIYLIRSVLGTIGEPTRDYYTFGILKNNNKVYKQMWLIPELILDKEYEDDISLCFGEAFIHDQKETKNRTE